MPSMPPRLKRLTHSLAEGEKILTFLQQPEQISAMVGAADRGLPSVVGISAALLKRFGPTIKETVYKQYSGMAIRWLLAQSGFEILDQGVKIQNDPVFASGTRYRHAPKLDEKTTSRVAPGGAGSRSDLIDRFVSVLDRGELEHLIRTAQSELVNRST